MLGTHPIFSTAVVVVVLVVVENKGSARRLPACCVMGLCIIIVGSAGYTQ